MLREIRMCPLPSKSSSGIHSQRLRRIRSSIRIFCLILNAFINSPGPFPIVHLTARELPVVLCVVVGNSPVVFSRCHTGLLTQARDLFR